MKVVTILIVTVTLVLLGTWAYAADCNNGGRYANNYSNGTVTDCRTGLIWLQDANCTDSVGGIDKSYGYLTWHDAMKWVAALSSGLCGLSDGSDAGDWRLPTKTEWMAMVAYGKKMKYANPILTNAAGTAQWTTNGDAFNNVQSYYYWSSTTYAANTTYAWFVYMNYGYVSAINKTAPYYVWPVRAGQSGTFGTLFIE